MSSGERDDFLSRWSRRKVAARATPAAAAAPSAAGVVPAPAGTQSPLPEKESPPPAPLPAVESLTPESDFTPFMRSEVDPSLRRQALRTLFRDPRFNVMDGLDVYIDDYSKPDPIPPEWLEKLTQMARLGDYRPPEEPAEAATDPAPSAEAAAIPPPEQGSAEAVALAESDTSDAGSPPPELKET